MVAVLSGLVAGCKHAPAPEIAPAPLDVRFGGCARVLRTGACVPDEARVLHLWIEGARPETVTASANDTISPRLVHGGVAFDAKLPRGELRITATRADGQRGEWRLAIHEDDTPAWLVEVDALHVRGELDAAEAKLDAGLAHATTDSERAWATRHRARIELRRGHVERTVALFREAIRLERAAGLSSNEGEDTAALSFVLGVREHDNAAALRALDDAADAFAHYAEGRVDDLMSRGTVAYASGDWRGTLRYLSDAIVEAERLSMRGAVAAARTTYALELEYLGRWREALTTLQALLDGETDEPCARAGILVNVGEGRLLAIEAGATDAGDPLPPLEDAVALYRSKCEYADERANALASVALAKVRRGEIDAAAKALAEARKTVAEPDPALSAAFSELEGRIALAEKRYAAARDAFAREERVGAFRPVEQWRGAYGRAEALEAMGSREAAIEAYTTAERALDEAVLGVPIGEGRDTFVADREASARALVDLLVRAGRPNEALARARAARGRVIGALARAAHVASLEGDARQRWLGSLDAYRRAREALATDAAADWRRPKDAQARARDARKAEETKVRALLDAALAQVSGSQGRDRAPTPPEGALILAYAPVRRGWMAFAATRDRTRAVPFDFAPGDTPERLAAAFVAPFRAEIAAAREVLVAPHGAARAIDVHALPLDGEPLVAKIPVRYVLDVDRTPTAAGGYALVLSDPTSDLEAARTEAARVRAALEAGPAPVHAFTGLAVTTARMAEELPGAGLLHFAGHGVYAGREGWESALPLANGARWSVGDVLALTHAPAQVVLTACEGARSSSDAAEGLGLAQAFVIAGSQIAVAPTRPVQDAVAGALADGLYASLGRGTPLAAALRDAQIALWKRDPQADWAAFRALTP